MRVLISEDSTHEISVSEDLEPTFVSFIIQQGTNNIVLSEYEAKELKITLD